MTRLPLAPPSALGLAVLLVAAPLGAQRTRPAPSAEPPPAALVPRTTFDGPTFDFDFPAVHVGVAEYDAGPTGATVFHFPNGVAAAVDVRGGAPGTTATDFLRLGYSTTFVDAIAFAGGSSYGLAAAAGVAAELRDRSGSSGAWGSIATVPGAIIFDLGNRRFTTVTPDEALGRAALRAAVPGRFPLGPRGAGRFAMQGGFFDTPRPGSPGGFYDRRQHSGQGAAFRQVGPTKIAVFTVVNALGVVVDRDGRVVRCSSDPAVRECGTVADLLARTLAERASAAPAPAAPPADASDAEGPSRHTTLTLVVVNRKLDFWALQRLAVQVHSSMARAIQPFHTQQDGDVLFAVTTAEVDDAALPPPMLGVVAGEVAWDAVLRSVPPLPPRDTVAVRADAAVLDAVAGRYVLGPDAALVVTRDGERLFVEAAGPRPVYGFVPGERAEVRPTADGHFVSRNVRRDRLRFDRDARGRVTGLELNPGPWGLPARRLP